MLGTVFGYFLLVLLWASFIWLAYLLIKLVIEYFRSSINSLKEYLKVIFKLILIIVGIILLGGIINLLEPVWEGIDNGFQEVWNNIKDTWIIIVFKNIFKFVFIFLFWVWWIGFCGFFGYIVGMIPNTIVNSLLKRILRKKEEIPIFPIPPKNFLETFSLLLTIAFVVTPILWIFFKLAWRFLSSIKYTIVY